MQKISNDLLLQVIEFSKKNISLSLRDCAKKLEIKPTTLHNWRNNFKKKKWPKNYSKTQDKEPLKEEIVEEFY